MCPHLDKKRTAELAIDWKEGRVEFWQRRSFAVKMWRTDRINAASGAFICDTAIAHKNL